MFWRRNFVIYIKVPRNETSASSISLWISILCEDAFIIRKEFELSARWQVVLLTPWWRITWTWGARRDCIACYFFLFIFTFFSPFIAWFVVQIKSNLLRDNLGDSPWFFIFTTWIYYLYISKRDIMDFFLFFNKM